LLHAIIKENKEQKEDEWIKENINGIIYDINLWS
jgi:post-segregation antitoxin (ccd killing protein)